MDILVLGVNHKTAPLEIREKLSVPSGRTREMMQLLRERHVFAERLILSTCNRTEIYGVVEKGARDIGLAKETLSEYAQLDLNKFEDKLYVLRQPDSVKHLFSVASGLDSMVLGETEIIGQVKDAYLTAQREGQTGKVLNALFQRSLRVAKNLRTQTEIGVGRVSVASVAVDLALKIFEDLSRVRVFVIGTGDMAAQVARAMASKGASPLIISSRHRERAAELAGSLQADSLRYEEVEGRIAEADILIASTACTETLIRAEQVKQWMKSRHQKPLFLIDIAVPRNIDASVEKLDNVYLYNIDDLKEITEKNRSLREGQVEECESLVQGQTQRFMQWLIKEFGGRGDYA